jgi:transcription initiation factor TFIIIB Brf1 subunit/transcription initiation factor TFIIB
VDGEDCGFSLFSGEEFADMFEPTNQGKPPEIVKFKSCEVCHTRMKLMGYEYECLDCGLGKKVILQTDAFNPNVVNNYNSNKNCSLALKIVGKGSYRYHKALLRTASDYSKVQCHNTSRQLSQYNNRSKGGKFSAEILKEAGQLYHKIQSYKIVLRGKNRGGTLMSCLGFICKKHDITKKPKVLAAYGDVEESYVSEGDKLLRRLQAEGKLDIPIHHDPTYAFIFQYFKMFDIPTKYEDFALKLIEASQDTSKMMGENTSRISTQCAGAVYVLNLQLNLGFSKDDIVSKCNIVRSTFTRYYDFLITNRKILRPVFDAHGIPKLRKDSAKKTKARKMTKTPSGPKTSKDLGVKRTKLK